MQYWNNPLGNRKKKQKRNLHLLYFKANRGGGASRRNILVLHSLSLTCLGQFGHAPFRWCGQAVRNVSGRASLGLGGVERSFRVARQVGSGFCFARKNSYNKKTKQTSHFCACVRKVRVLPSVMDSCERKFMKLKANTHTYTVTQRT